MLQRRTFIYIIVRFILSGFYCDLATHMGRKNRKRLLYYTHWDCYYEIWIWNNKIRGVDILSSFQRTIPSPFSARNICLILKYFKLDHHLQLTGEDSLRRQTKLRWYETKRTVMKVLMPVRIFDSNSGCVFPAKTTSCLKITTALYHFVIVVDECLSQTNIPN
jgi:hypothetical protein